MRKGYKQVSMDCYLLKGLLGNIPIEMKIPEVFESIFVFCVGHRRPADRGHEHRLRQDLPRALVLDVHDLDNGEFKSKKKIFSC